MLWRAANARGGGTRQKCRCMGVPCAVWGPFKTKTTAKLSVIFVHRDHGTRTQAASGVLGDPEAPSLYARVEKRKDQRGKSWAGGGRHVWPSFLPPEGHSRPAAKGNGLDFLPLGKRIKAAAMQRRGKKGPEAGLDGEGSRLHKCYRSEGMEEGSGSQAGPILSAPWIFFFFGSRALSSVSKRSRKMKPQACISTFRGSHTWPRLLLLGCCPASVPCSTITQDHSPSAPKENQEPPHPCPSLWPKGQGFPPDPPIWSDKVRTARAGRL